MSDYVPFLIFGVATGTIYGISAMGLVLTYKTSGVLNFGHGAVCAASAFIFYSLRQQAGLPWPVAAVLVVLVIGPLVGLVMEWIARVLAPAPTAYKIVGTVGLLVAVRAVVSLIYTDRPRDFQTFFPQGEAFTLSGAVVTWDTVITMTLGLAAAVGVGILFRFSRLGVSIRGVVDDPRLIDLTGIAPARVRRRAWMIGSAFASASGALFASNQGELDINVLTLLVVQAFGAATVARFSSVPGALAGGILVGVLQKVVSKETGSAAELQGLDLAVPFLVLFIGLLVIPRHRLVEIGQAVRPHPRPLRSAPVSLRVAGYTIGALVLLLVPHVVGSKLSAYQLALTQVVLFTSLHLLVRTSGQISLCHVGLAAIGACGFARSQDAGLPFGIAVLIGGAACVPAAVVIAIPAVRLSGLYLALATLGFGLALQLYFYNKSYMFAGGQLTTHRPQGFAGDKALYYLLLGITVAVLLLTVAIEHSRLGRLLRAIGDSPIALATLGTSVNVARVLVFTISGFLAGISGALFASLFGSTNPESFNPLQSLIALSVLAISGRRTVSASFTAAALAFVVPAYLTNANAAQLLQVGFGVAAVMAAAASTGALDTWWRHKARAFEHRQQGPAGDRFTVDDPDSSWRRYEVEARTALGGGVRSFDTREHARLTSM